MLLLQAGDLDADALTYSWDLGDGTTGSGRPPMPLGHVYADDGVYTIRLTVSDGHGGTDTKTTTATIANVAPVIPAEGGLTGPSTPIQLAAGGASAPIRLAFGDPAATHDTYAARIECGNGTVLSPTGITSPCAATCTYTAAGVYTVSATVSDEDGGTSAVARFDDVIVYDPAGAFATGGGWLTSPPAACPSLCGGATSRAVFAFDAKYPSGGAAAPDGSATLLLIQTSRRNPWRRDAKLDFRSTSLEVLIVAGQRIQLWGSGTLNGVPGYTFRITAVDGGSAGAADAFRIEIWDPGMARVYDTEWGAARDAPVTTPVDGGQIAIHRRWRFPNRRSGA
jgi:PKD repeat protein